MIVPREDLTNIDRKPNVTFELKAKAELDESGRPRLVQVEPIRWNAVLARLAGKGPLTVTLARQKLTRSDAANRLLWGWVYPQVLEGLRELAVEAGGVCPFNNTEDLHEAMKHLVLGVTEIQLPDGGRMEVPATTTRLNTVQFSAYIERVVEWARDRKIFVDPSGESA